MAEAVVVKYCDIEITYNEGADCWQFELRGRSRSAESLAKAKEAIDKPAPSEKQEPPFNRAKAYKSESWTNDGDFSLVDVTSIAEGNGFSTSVNLWVVANGKREKVGLEKLFAVSAENDALIAEMKSLSNQELQLQKQRNRMAKLLRTLEV
jgi:hypothetical protein